MLTDDQRLQHLDELRRRLKAPGMLPARTPPPSSASKPVPVRVGSATDAPTERPVDRGASGNSEGGAAAQPLSEALFANVLDGFAGHVEDLILHRKTTAESAAERTERLAVLIVFVLTGVASGALGVIGGAMLTLLIVARATSHG